MRCPSLLLRCHAKPPSQDPVGPGIRGWQLPGVSPPRRPPAACTIISRNYLSHARILAQSYARHEPGGRFYVLVVDGLPEGVEVGADVHLLGPDDLDRLDFYELCFMYDV